MQSEWASLALTGSGLLMCLSFWLSIRIYRDRELALVKRLDQQEEYLQELKEALKLVNRGAMGIGNRLHRSEKVISNLVEISAHERKRNTVQPKKDRHQLSELMIQGVAAETVMDTFGLSRGEADILHSLNENRLKKEKLNR